MRVYLPLLIGTMVATLSSGYWISNVAFPKVVDRYAGLRIGASCDDVRYILGNPATMRVSINHKEPPDELEDLEVDKIPKGRRFCDYHSWIYELPYGAELSVSFSNERKVNEISCATGQRTQTCPAIRGVQDGASEADVENVIGQPENKKIVNLGDTRAVKLMLLFPSKGLTFILERDQLKQLTLSKK